MPFARLAAFFGWCRLGLVRLTDRIWAKLAFHHSLWYRELVSQACGHSHRAIPAKWQFERLRQFDSDGLGIWYLARAGRQPRLEEICSRAIAVSRLGPPRPVARLLDRSLSGVDVCWFGESGGFDALAAVSLTSAGLAAALMAADLIRSINAPPFGQAANSLTQTANAMQSAVRARDRVMRGVPSAAQGASRWIFQAVNVVRRAQNHTDLLATDEQMARDVARHALAAANSACIASRELTSTSDTANTATACGAAHDRLAALARTVDALASRVAATLRIETPTALNVSFLLDPSSRVLSDAAKAVRPWNIQLPSSTDSDESCELASLGRRANDLAAAASDMLECWAALHEIIGKPPAAPRAGATTAAPGIPLWATRLMETVARKIDHGDVVQAIRDLSGPPDRSAAAAVCFAALRGGSLQLRRELWKLIRAAHTPDLARSLAFQLFWRLER